MKKILVTLLLVSLVIEVQAQPQYYTEFRRGGSDLRINGEHTPLIFEDIFTWDGDSTFDFNGTAYACMIGGAANDSIRTPWMQIGYSTTASAMQNSFIHWFNPEVFTLSVTFRTDSDDSLGARAWFEVADDTTLYPFWNGDSSNYFLQDGGAGHSFYGNGVYEAVAIAGDSLTANYSLRVTRGGWLRIWMFTVVADCTFISADLWCEN